MISSLLLVVANNVHVSSCNFLRLQMKKSGHDTADPLCNLNWIFQKQFAD